LQLLVRELQDPAPTFLTTTLLLSVW